MTPPEIDIYEALAHPYRRRLLLAMCRADDHGVAYPNPLEFAPVVRGEPGKSRRIAMAHTHLPKLDDMGIVEWDREAEELATGPAWDELEPLLRWMDGNRDELPEGWLPEEAIDYHGNDEAAETRSES